MIQLRTYGNQPYIVALVHGGPGAGGEMAPVARRFSEHCGVLEPIQIATRLAGQVTELCTILKDYAAIPVTLVGYSWGAWLSCMVAAQFPALVGKLVLVSSAPFEEQYAAVLKQNREMRLTQAETLEYAGLVEKLSNPDAADKDDLLEQLGLLSVKTDMYDPLPVDVLPEDMVELDGRIFHAVWNEAAEMLRTGRLLELAAKITCPVTAIHGDHDPHPADGVRLPLSARLKEFKFILLEHCGHTPWHERQARDPFFRVLAQEITC
jgi:pimeloyl-ACP methyl ester carboxylesterase